MSPSDLAENGIGFLAAVISFVMFVPQARLTWQARGNPEALKAVSLGTQWFILCNATLWGFYAVLTSAFWTGAPGLVNFPLAVFTIVAVRRARAGDRQLTTASLEGDKESRTPSPVRSTP